MGSFQRNFYEHMKSNWFLYTVVLTFFVAGLTVGAYGVQYLSTDQAANLSNYVDMFLSQLGSENVATDQYAYRVIKESLIFIALLYILGLTIIGFPVVLGLTFIKGFKLGFTVGFLVQEKALNGVLFALLSLLPQNLLYVPVILIGAVASISFSFLMLKGLFFSQRIPLPKYFLKYTVYMIVLAFFVTGAGLLESYVTPVFMKAIAAYIQ